jgi:hypothetical protein
MRTCRFKKFLFDIFFALARYMVVKTAHSYFDMVLRTTKHTKFYPGSCLSLAVIALHLVV